MKCVTVEYIDESFDLCDLEIDGGSNNYVAEGMVVHNTWTCLAFNPNLNDPELLDGCFFATSKGLSEQGLVLKHNDANANNLYQKTLLANLVQLKGMAEQYQAPFFVLGETFGPVQDLTYGLTTPKFRVFDIYSGEPGNGIYIDDADLDAFCECWGFERVPVLYRGPYSKEVELMVRDGKDTISGVHMREGVVIKPVTERYDPVLGRVQLKSVSPDYLLRKGKKGQETTEFQ